MRVELPARICARCEQRLAKWLRDLPDRYALLPRMVEPGSVTDRNPDAKTTKQPHAPAPLRLAAVDLLDNRRGRRHGEALEAMLEAGVDPVSARTPDGWRGVVGLLHSWAGVVRDAKRITPPTRITVAGEAAFLLRHSLWIGEQEWVGDFYREIKRLAESMADAVAEWRARQIGKCPAEIQGKPCRGPVFPSDDGGVHCPRCGATWNDQQLRMFGLVQLTTEGES